MKTKKKTTKKSALKLDPWMPINTPCSECEHVYRAKQIIVIGQPPITGCKKSKDGFGHMPNLSEFRDPHLECELFEGAGK